MGFFRPNTELVKHGSKLKMDTCQNKTSIPISRYARNLDSLIKMHFLNKKERESYNKDNFVRKYYNIFKLEMNYASDFTKFKSVSLMSNKLP